MNQPLTINLQINVYPDGTISVNGVPPSYTSVSPSGVWVTTSQAQVCVGSESGSKESPPSTPVNGGPTESGGTGLPSESDVRTALLAAVKASDKVKAVGVLERIAQVSRVPEVPEHLRATVIAELNAIVAASKTPV